LQGFAEGNPADSGEHRIKRSDLKSVAGVFSQSDPLYLHSAKHKNRRIGSLDAKALKYSQSLCQFCNNTRTRSHDLAWQELSETLRFQQPPIIAGQRIRTSRIFPYNTRHTMRHVHLYIVKMLGCMLIEGGVTEIDIGPFANAILNNRVHPNVYAAFGPAPKDEGEDNVIAGSSDLEMDLLEDGQCAFAACIHHVGNLWIRIMYATDGENRQKRKPQTRHRDFEQFFI
jgi:hypothetical protein